jgi:hypothetical protein
MEETGVPRENQRPVASHWQTHIMLYWKWNAIHCTCCTYRDAFLFFSYLTDLSYFPLKIVVRKLQDTIGTGKKWPYWKRGVDGFNYFSLISVILFSIQNHPVIQILWGPCLMGDLEFEIQLYLCYIYNLGNTCN